MFTALSNNSYLGISLAHWLVIVSAALGMSGSFVYIHGIFKGRSKPNLVTWGLWALAPLIAVGSAVSVHADSWITVRIFIAGFGPLLVFLAGIFVSQNYWKLTKFDYACGVLSLVALCAWLLAGLPLLAILLAAAADMFATLPTIIKAWKYPETEIAYTYFVSHFASIIAMVAIPIWNIQNSAFQIYLLTANATLFLVISRGYLLKRKI